MKSKKLEEIYYHIEFNDETKREIDPFELRNFLSDKCKQKFKDITTDRKNWFSFTDKTNEELNNLSEIKKVDFFSEITFHKFLDKKKIIYTQNYKRNEEFEKKNLEKSTHSSKTQSKRVSSSQGTLTLRQYFLLFT